VANDEGLLAGHLVMLVTSQARVLCILSWTTLHVTIHVSRPSSSGHDSSSLKQSWMERGIWTTSAPCCATPGHGRPGVLHESVLGGGVLDSSCITYRAISHAPPASAFCTHCDVDESCAAASASIDKLQLLGLSGGSWAGGGVFVLAVPLHSPLCPISHAPHSPCLCWGHLQVAVCCRQLLVLAGNVFFCTFAKLHTCCCTAMCCCRLDHGWLVGVMQGDITQCAAVV
jgi:hypothetical protein